MSLEEFEDNTDPKTRRYINMRSIKDLGMGFIYLGIAFLLLFAQKLNFHNDFAESTIGKIFAGVVLIYGSWRIYRGIKKDYLR